MQAKAERFEMRVDSDVLERVDTWRAGQDDLPTRSEAMRRLIEIGLSADDDDTPVTINDGDRLILMMLRDISKKLDAKGKKHTDEIDPDFISAAVTGGHLWGLEWEYTGLFHRHADRRQDVREVADILDMWWFIELASAKFSKAELARIEAEAGPYAPSKFAGFDGNNEASQLSIANFMIEHLGRFTDFAGRELNSHHPTLDAYRRMLGVFKNHRSRMDGRGLNVSAVIEILKARGA